MTIGRAGVYSDKISGDIVAVESHETIAILAASVLIGTVLGLRHKAFVLIPAAVIGFAVVVGIGIAYGAGILFTLLVAVLAITALQMGYLAGALIGYFAAKPRVRKDTPGIILVAQQRSRRYPG